MARKRLYIADCLLLGQDNESYWLEVQMPDGSRAAISLSGGRAPLIEKVFTDWAKQTIEKLETSFVEQVNKQFGGERENAKSESNGAEDTDTSKTS